MSNKNQPIGIDLGTVNSVLAIYRNNKTELIQCQDLRITPSFIFYDPDNDEVGVGNPSDYKAVKNPSNAIYDTKRLIGRSFDDENVQQILNNYQFGIKRSSKNGIHIPINQKGRTIYKTPQEISSEILKSFKETASQYLNTKVTEAVITVPAYFNYAQRNATKQAAELAGLKVLMLLNEPTAAALHYISERVENDSTCLVFDLGGGTLDISIVRFSGKNIDTLNIDGDSFLGGRNFDEALLQHIIESRKLELNERQKRRLSSKIEEAKKKISYRKSYTLLISKFFGDEDLELEISRKEFEEINSNRFQKCIDLIERSLKNCGLQKQDIDKIILVGGSTKIPKIKEMIKDYCTDKKILTDLNSDEAVASGAAIQAAAMKGLIKKRFNVIDVAPLSLGVYTAMKGLIKERFNVINVTPFSLGVYTAYDRMCTIIKKGSPVPVKSSKEIVTGENYQTTMSFDIYGGERYRCKFNNLLGSFTLMNLPPKPAGQVTVLITFLIDGSGLLKVIAEEKSSGEVKAELQIDVTLFKLKSKYQGFSLLINEFKEDKLFEEFVGLKFKIDTICVKFICYKTENDPDVKECKQFIEELRALEFEERIKLAEMIKAFKNKISDSLLINDIIFIYLIQKLKKFHV